MEYLLEKVDFKDKKSGEKNGKRWSFTPVGIRISGKWHNGIINDDSILETLKEGCKIDLILYEEEGKDKYAGKTFSKFKFPSENDRVKSRLDRVEQALKKIYDSPKIVELLNL